MLEYENKELKKRKKRKEKSSAIRRAKLNKEWKID